MAFNKALIVDDSKLARVTLKKKLEAHGLAVHAVESAEQAYGCLESIKPDIIFMDHLMPDVDGFEATGHIRQMGAFRQTPIVMCTGKDHDGYLEEALAIGANFILSKPPVDEALSAILEAGGESQEEAVDKTSETDVADFLSGQDEKAEHIPAATMDVMPVPETDISDFMEEPVEAVKAAEPAVFAAPLAAASVASTPAVVGGISAEEIASICRQIIADERAIIINNVLAAIPAPVAPAAPEVIKQVAGVTADEVAEICEDLIAHERNAIIHDVLASVPAPAIPDMSDREVAEVDMESILSTVNTTINHQLAVKMSSIKNDVFEQILQNIDSMVAEKISENLGSELQSILDLRMNVMSAEQNNASNARIEELERRVSEQLQTISNASDLFSLDSPMKLTQRNDMSDRVKDLYDKFIALQAKLKVFQIATLVSGAIAIAAVVIAVIR